MTSPDRLHAAAAIRTSGQHCALGPRDNARAIALNTISFGAAYSAQMSDTRARIADWSAGELRGRAPELRQMAAVARTRGVMDALNHLADRFEKAAVARE